MLSDLNHVHSYVHDRKAATSHMDFPHKFYIL